MDVVDEAKRQERQDRDRAKKNQKQKTAVADAEQPLWINGMACCRDCQTPLDNERIGARPNAARCIPCKKIWEKKDNGR
ncbi:MAG: hypothetical protein RPU13_07605 [Candidatus Sedimenticola sp. (ex Thyasira tokunagai)]